MAVDNSSVRNLAEVGESYFESDYNDSFNNAFSYIGSQVAGRTTEILAIRYALLLGQHVLLYGPHGTAKSYLAMKTFEAINDATVFSLQLRKEMGVDYVFGPMDIKKYRDKGLVSHNTVGMLPECEFAFLDEFFDANDNVLRGLLECLFERRFMGRNIPLRTVIATTNFYEEDAKKDAVIDRFMFRVRVEPLTKRNDKRSMLSAYQGRRNLPKSFDMALLDDAEDALSDVTIDKSWLVSLFDIVDNYSKQINKTYPVSDRRLCWCLDMLKASALLDGRYEVTDSDFRGLYFVLGVPKTGQHDAAFFAAYDMVFPSTVPEEGKQDSIMSCFKDFDDATTQRTSLTEAIFQSIRDIGTAISDIPSISFGPGHCSVSNQQMRSIKITAENIDNISAPEASKKALVDTSHRMNACIGDIEGPNSSTSDLNVADEMVFKTAVRMSLDLANIIPKIK